MARTRYPVNTTVSITEEGKTYSASVTYRHGGIDVYGPLSTEFIAVPYGPLTGMELVSAKIELRCQVLKTLGFPTGVRPKTDL